MRSQKGQMEYTKQRYSPDFKVKVLGLEDQVGVACVALPSLWATDSGENMQVSILCNFHGFNMC